MDNTDKLIQDKFKALPIEIKEALARTPWKERIADIAKREGLDDEKTTGLETETMLVLYGFTPVEEYNSNIMSEVGLESEVADRITKEVTDEVFAEIEKQYELIEATTSAVEPKMVEISQPIVPVQNQMSPTQTSTLTPPTTTTSPSTIEIPPQTLPAVETGQSAHNTTPQEKAFMNTPVPAPTPAPIPSVPKSIVEEKMSQVTVASASAATPKAAPSYKAGVDPYREPVE
jgi:hypothetical protein